MKNRLRAGRFGVTIGLVLAAALILSSNVTRYCWAQDSYDDKMSTAIKFHSDKKYDEAIFVLQGLTKSAPERPEAYFWLGKAQFEKSNWPAARDAFTRYAELSTTPKDKADGYTGAARANKKENNLGSAADCYKKALAQTPNDEALRKEADDLNKGTTPPTVEPKKEEAAKDEEKKDDDAGFWHKGVFGVCGGRSAWWGWVIGLVIYVPGLIMGAAMTGGIQRAQMESMGQPNAAAGAAFFTGLIGVVIGFIIFWGLPSSILGWIVMGVVALVGAGIASAAAAKG